MRPAAATAPDAGVTRGRRLCASGWDVLVVEHDAAEEGAPAVDDRDAGPLVEDAGEGPADLGQPLRHAAVHPPVYGGEVDLARVDLRHDDAEGLGVCAVSYTHLRAHETKANLVCRLLL